MIFKCSEVSDHTHFRAVLTRSTKRYLNHSILQISITIWTLLQIFKIDNLLLKIQNFRLFKISSHYKYHFKLNSLFVTHHFIRKLFQGENISYTCSRTKDLGMSQSTVTTHTLIQGICDSKHIMCHLEGKTRVREWILSR